jgi:hypothetical protein
LAEQKTKERKKGRKEAVTALSLGSWHLKNGRSQQHSTPTLDLRQTRPTVAEEAAAAAASTTTLAKQANWGNRVIMKANGGDIKRHNMRVRPV